jgi:hypothetical protein
VLCLSAAGAEAQGRAYRRIVREAVGEFDAGNWAEARALFEEAHELAPSARTLRGLGMCAFELREYPEAMRLLRQALDEERRPLTRRQRAQVEELLERAQTFIGRYIVFTEPPGAFLRVDDAPAEPNDYGELELGVGDHTIEASLDGYEPERRRVEVHGGESEELTLTLRELATAEPAAGAGEPDFPLGPVAVLLAGAGALVFGGASIGWTLDRVSELGVCEAPPEGLRCTNQDTLVSQRDAAIGSMIGAAITATGLGVAGAIWWWLEGAGEPGEPTEARARCGPIGPGAGCAGRF